MEHSVIIRMTEENKQLLLRAAQHAGAGLSTWIRMIAIEKAAQILSSERGYRSENDRRVPY